MFALVSPYAWHVIAAGVGVLAGSAGSYALNHLLIFRRPRTVTPLLVVEAVAP
jgi:hypothetical protein